MPPRFDELRIDSQAAGAFPASEMRLPSGRRRVCLRDPAGGRGLWLTMASDAPPASDGLRLRPVIVGPDTRAHALVWDWAYRRAAEAGEHRLTTTLLPGSDGAGTCEDADAIGEATGAAQLGGLTYVAARGTFEPSAAVAGALTFQAIGTIEHGLAVRAQGLGDRGVTVWSRPMGEALTRLERGRDYLYQRDADDAVVVYLRGVVANQTITIAGPGHEPAS